MRDINWGALLIDWFPMLVLVGVWLYFMRQMQSAKSPQRQYMAAHLAEQKRHNEQMERLIAALVARGDAKS